MAETNDAVWDKRELAEMRLKGQIAELEAKLRKAELELQLRRQFMESLPFCPDHRDKVKGKPCRECEIETLTRKLKRASRLIAHLQDRLDEVEMADDDNWLLEDEYE